MQIKVVCIRCKAILTYTYGSSFCDCKKCGRIKNTEVTIAKSEIKKMFG